ncbi:MAG: autotransporter outer membrane beta-barrel domain-containing protein [Gammaproteobacteria bacterium AqS3]|nr:autotransporter outer membrane beta-barrel domain-containing protein [Gammaproteobacteria bacterium AqS3]
MTVIGDEDITVNPASLDFTTDNWDTGQLVIVRAAQDDDKTDDTATINLTGTGIIAASVEVSVTDDDVNTMPEEEEETVKLQLAEIAGSLLSSTSDVIKIRLDAPRGGRSAVVDGQQLALDRSLMQDIAAGFASRAGGQDAAVQSRFASGRFGAERQSADWLGGIVLEEGRPVRSEAHSTSGMGEAAALLSSFSYALAPNTEGGSGWSVWGRFDTRDFSGSTAENAEFDGSQSGFWLGFDTNTNERVSFGLALGSASADSAYTLGSASGNLDTTMTTVLPYLELKSEGGSTARVILGLGSGEVTLMQTSQSEISADVSMELMAISGSWPVAQLGSSTLSWTGDLGISSLKPETGQEPNALDGLDVASTRFRGGMELEHGGFGSTWKTAPRFGLSVRHDGGDGATGTGVELTAGLQMRSSEERFSLDISLRTLGMHSAEDMTDTSASVEFRLNSRPSGEGMSFTLGPYWGAAEDGLLERDEAFRLDQADMSYRRQRQQERGVAAKLAYGLRGLGGMLEPYSEYDFTSGEYGSMRQVTGVKFSRFDTLELRLFSERQVSGQSPVRSKLRVELKKQF